MAPNPTTRFCRCLPYPPVRMSLPSPFYVWVSGGGKRGQSSRGGRGQQSSSQERGEGDVRGSRESDYLSVFPSMLSCVGIFSRAGGEGMSILFSAFVWVSDGGRARPCVPRAVPGRLQPPWLHVARPACMKIAF